MTRRKVQSSTADVESDLIIIIDAVVTAPGVDELKSTIGVTVPRAWGFSTNDTCEEEKAKTQGPEAEGEQTGTERNDVWLTLMSMLMVIMSMITHEAARLWWWIKASTQGRLRMPREATKARR